VRGDAVEGQDYDRDKLTWLWDVTTHADKRIIETNAKGVMSSHYQPGPLSEMERFLGTFLEWYLEAISTIPVHPAATGGRQASRSLSRK
jgi:Rieske 2Fe-2S family protein